MVHQPKHQTKTQNASALFLAVSQGLEAQTPLTPTRTPQGSVSLERETTNWAEIALRDRGLSPSAPPHIRLVKENIKQRGTL